MHKKLATSELPRLHAVFRVWMSLVVGGAVVVLCGGCGKTVDARFLPVSGRVTLDGQPLTHASVAFQSTNDEIAAITRDDGTYQLKPGAMPGDYRVYISKRQGSPQAAMRVEPGTIGRVPAASAAPALPQPPIPTRYSDPQQTELRFSVAPPGTTQADFELRSR